MHLTDKIAAVSIIHRKRIFSSGGGEGGKGRWVYALNVYLISVRHENPWGIV